MLLNQPMLQAISLQPYNRFAIFFSSSAPRWSNLAFNTELAHRIRQKVLKKVCLTRWEARHESVLALKERYVDVLKSLTLYSLTSKKTEERCIAVSLKKKIVF